MADDKMLENRERLTDIILKRDIDRKKDAQKRKEEKDLINAEHEQISHFTAAFEEKQLEISSALDYTEKVNSIDLPYHFDNITKQIQLLQKFVSASALFLRNYDIKKCQNVLQLFISRSHDLEELYLPKKKFGFKNKKVMLKKDSPKKIVSKDVSDGLNKTDNFLQDENFCGFKSKSNEKLVLNNDTIFKKDVTLHTLKNCIVIIYGSAGTLHLTNLEDCVIISGPVSTSVFAENCKNCKLAFACQQLRLHSSVNCDIYLHVTSRAIMEDCKNIQLAPYNISYNTLKEDFIKSGLDMSVNNWTSIDDFNWLSSETKSPNWLVLDEHLRVSDWKTIVGSDL